MQALVYHRSVTRYLASRLLSRFRRRAFSPRIAPLTLRETPLSIPGEGWVKLRNRMCGICGSDLRLLQGAESFLLEPYASLPAILGHEVVSEVVEAPAGSKWRAGDRVAVEPVLPCETRGTGPCRFCSRGLYNLCENFTSGSLAPGGVLGFNQSVGGGMAQMMYAHPRQLIGLPDTISDEKAVLADSLASALQPVLDNFPDEGDTVVVYGAGILGQHIARILKTLGPGLKMVVVARHKFQKDLAEAGGADIVLMSPDRVKLGKAVGARIVPTTLGGGNLEGGADVFFDCVASSHSFQEGLLALRAKGRYVMVGTAAKLGPVDVSSLWFRELVVTGSSSYSIGNYLGEPVRTYQAAVDLLSRGDYPVEGLLSHTFALKDYSKAFETAYDKSRHSSMKVAFDLRDEEETKGGRKEPV